MNVTTIYSNKKMNNEIIKKDNGILMKYKPLGLVKIQDQNISKKLIEGLKTIDAGFIVYNKEGQLEKISNNIVVTGKIDENTLSGFDFIICDDEIENINIYLENGIVPIILKNSHLSSILSEFNPIKNIGNSFFYDSLNQWSIFYATVRYLENYKFPYDNKNLVNNILKA